MIQGEETQAKDQQHTQQQHDHIENAEISELQSQSGFYARVREQTERFASTRLGQFVIVRADRALKLLEDTTKWSLPQDKNSSNVVLERPLPWVPFLLLIVLLRLARIWLSVGALLIGNGPVSPRDTIYFIQTRRRKLRAIRLHGLRVMRDRQQRVSSLAGKSFTQKVSQWMSRAICRPGVHHNEPQQQLVQPNQSVSKRPREEENVQEQNLTISEILNSYANANSEDDSDFVPNPEDEIDSSTSSESDSESHSSEEISSSEVLDNAKEHKRNKKLLYTNQPEREKSLEKEQEQEKKLNKTKIMSTTSNGSNNIDSNSKEQKEVVSQFKEEELDWKSSMGLTSSAFLNARLCNNTAAAAIPDQFNSNPSSNSNSNSYTHTDPNPTPKNDNDNDNDDSDTDSGSAKTICTAAADPQQEIPTDQSIQQITQSPPTVETLTPATSSEDIFYSPIGSPTSFNTVFQPHTPLQNVTITSVATHSTPNSEMEEAELNANNEIEVARHNISLARKSLIEPEVEKQQDEHNHQQQQQQEQQQHQQQQQPVKQQQQHHQQQRKLNHSHQRFRGRNIR